MTAIPTLTEEECYLVALLRDISGVDLAELCWVDEEKETNCYRIWDYQWAMYKCEAKYQIDSMVSRSAGKALSLDTPVPIPQGWTTMGELQAGDWVYGSDGQRVEVLQAHAVQYGRPCYEVEFDTGDMIVADEDHLWTTWTQNTRKTPRYKNNYVPPSTVTTKQMLDTLKYPNSQGRNAGNNHTIPTCKPIEGPVDYVDIDPYFLGIWLGDGTSQSSHITSADLEIIETLRSRGFIVTKTNTDYGWSVHYPGVDKHNWKTDSLSAHLRVMGLLNNKHIPEEYLRANIEIRTALLAGLMDSDGHITKTSHCEIILTDKKLMDGVAELVRSFGEKASLREGRATLYGKDCGPRWRLAWKPKFDPFWLARKSKVFAPSTTPDRLQWRVVAIRSIPSVPVRCITVDSKDSLYLVGKTFIPTHNTVGIKMRSGAFPFNYPGQEMLIGGPEKNHLKPLTDKIADMYRSIRLYNEMLPKRMGNGMSASPHWQATFINGARIISRIPNQDGRGFKSMHPVVIELDEAQNVPEDGFTEIFETLKTAASNARFLIHGVARGTRDKFYKLAMGEDPNLKFHRHVYAAMYRPNWCDEERKVKIAQYGSEDNIDYRRNLFGEHGDASNPIFVLARLMACVRINEDDWASEYNDNIYSKIKIDDEYLKYMKTSIENCIQPNFNHLDDQYFSYWAGMDVGFTRDPSELLVFGETKKGKGSLLRLLMRLHMMRISAEDQAAAVRHVFDFYGTRLRMMTMDRTGNGLPLWQMLNPDLAGTLEGNRTTPEHITKRIKGYGFSEKVAVDFEDREMELKERPEDLVIKRNVVDHGTDILRKWVDSGSIELPYDHELLTEWQGQQVIYVKEEGSGYGKRYQYGGGTFHTLDAAKMLAAGKDLEKVEAALKLPPRQPIIDMWG